MVVLDVGQVDLGTFKYRGVYAKGVLTCRAIRGHRTSSGGGVAHVEISGSGAARTNIGTIAITTSSALTCRGLWINGSPDVTVGKLDPGTLGTSGGALAIATGSHRATVRDFYLAGSGSTGTGISMASSQGLVFERGTVTGYALGVSGTGTLTGVAIGVDVSSNTTNTNVPAATFSVLGTTAFQL